LTQDDAIRELNELIEICKDSAEGFRTVAKAVSNTELETMFLGYADQRAEFAEELQSEVRRLDGDPAQSGHASAALHRGWIDLKAALSGGDPAALIAAAETGETSAEAEYSRAAGTDLTGQPKTLVTKQWEQVKQTLARLRRLKEETKDGTKFPKNQ
jgi:uncharacterized protein (TIGR02284 family)